MAIADPTDIADCELWLDASTITGLSDGEDVTTWEDGSGNGFDATGPAGNKPSYVADARNSLPAVRFDQSAGEYMTAHAAAAPFSGTDLPSTFYFVMTSGAVTAQQTIVSLQLNGANDLHEIIKIKSDHATSENILQVIRRDNGATLKSITTAKAWLGVDKWATVSEVFTGTASTAEVNGLRKWKAFSIDVGALTFDRFTIGALDGGTANLDGDVAEIVAYSRALSESEQDDLGEYLAAKYDLPWGPFNAAAAGTAPTPDSNNQWIHAHSSIYFPSGWNGYKYWIGYTPFYHQNDDLEEPCVAASVSDGQTWVTPAGGSNPVTADPVGVEHFADTHLMYNPVDDKLYLFYIWTDETTFNRLVVKSSSDGVTWSAQSTVLDMHIGGVANSNVVYDPDAIAAERFKLWYCQNKAVGGAVDREVHYRTSASVASGYSAASAIITTSPLPTNRDSWQQNLGVFKHGSLYLAVLGDGVSTLDGILYVGTSSDATTWDWWPSFLDHTDVDDATNWDSDTIYNAFFVHYADPATGGLVHTGADDDLQVWYSARDVDGGNNNWRSGYTTVPRNIADGIAVVAETTGANEMMMMGLGV